MCAYMKTNLEHLLTNFSKDQMVSGMAANPVFFEEAVNLAISDKQPYAWRASWLLWSCMESNDIRIRKHIPAIIQFLPVCRDNQQRELLKILYLMDVDEEHEGILYSHCVSIWEKLKKQPSARYNAFKMILKIAKKYPELHQEIEFLTQEMYTETLSQAVRRGVLRMIKEL
jgi:hypothetical protein